jgi:hypothetical protein
MANAEALYETLDVLLANREAWNQDHFISGYRDYQQAKSIGDCGTTQCVAGFRCLMDGLLPLRNRSRFVDPSTGQEVLADVYAEKRFELTGDEDYRWGVARRCLVSAKR